MYLEKPKRFNNLEWREYMMSYFLWILYDWLSPSDIFLQRKPMHICVYLWDIYRIENMKGMQNRKKPIMSWTSLFITSLTSLTTIPTHHFPHLPKPLSQQPYTWSALAVYALTLAHVLIYLLSLALLARPVLPRIEARWILCTPPYC
jgi:hypothetical protein